MVGHDGAADPTSSGDRGVGHWLSLAGPLVDGDLGPPADHRRGVGDVGLTGVHDRPVDHRAEVRLKIRSKQLRDTTRKFGDGHQPAAADVEPHARDFASASSPVPG
jgi:hypothetical protein